jgi:hypothetical protein
MKRLLCGSVVFAASIALASCSSDPTGDFRGDPARITASPSSVFLNQGADKAVVVRLEDDQGDPLPGDFELTATGSGITVERNPEFQGTTVGVPLESEAQFIITAGDAPLPSSFSLSAGGLSIDIPVVVLPTAVASAVFSNATPAMNQPVTVTAEGYTFLSSASVVIGGDSALILANDGTSLTFLPNPGGTGPAQLGGIAINFLPSAPLSIPTVAEITVAPLSAVPGTEAPATAPSLPVPAEGEIAGFFDGPDFAATTTHFYKLLVTEAGVYTVTMDWDLGSDIDLILCPTEAFAFDSPTDPTDDDDPANCDLTAATGAHPEVGEYNLTPGDYWVWADDFAPFDDPPGTPAIGAEIQIVVQHDPPAAEIRKVAAAELKVRK